MNKKLLWKKWATITKTAIKTEERNGIAHTHRAVIFFFLSFVMNLPTELKNLITMSAILKKMKYQANKSASSGSRWVRPPAPDYRPVLSFCNIILFFVRYVWRIQRKEKKIPTHPQSPISTLDKHTYRMIPVSRVTNSNTHEIPYIEKISRPTGIWYRVLAGIYDRGSCTKMTKTKHILCFIRHL